MPYKETSYAEVLLWLQDTEIHYVPHGKKAGTKSFDRYEKYSQAKTVAQALEFGSKPLDLVHDFEKKLLKRVGGPLREKPLNLAEVADTSTLSKTDLIIGRWGYMLGKKDAEGGEGAEKAASPMASAGAVSLKQRRMEQKVAYKKAQLSAKFGVKADDMAQGTNWAESPAMVAMRSRANVEAGSILEAAEAEGRKITDADVLRVLRLWAVKKNADRKNVMPEGMTSVHSETVGLLHCAGARLMPTLHVAQYPKVLTLFSKWMKDHRPEGHTQDFPFTSIFVNSGYAAKRHRDHLNLGPTVVKAFGEFQGGNLRYWSEDDKSASLEVFEEKDAGTINVRDGATVIDGNRAHAVEPYTGEERFSLVFFTTQSHEKVTPEVREQLVQVGIPVPDEAAATYLKGLLPAPKGYVGYAEKHRQLSDKDKSNQRRALSMLQGLNKPKTGLLLGKMLGGKAAGGAGENGEPKKTLTPLASKGLLARVLAKRALGENPAKQSAPSGQKPVKQLRPGGLLARVQKLNQEPAGEKTESTPDHKGDAGPPLDQPGALAAPVNKGPPAKRNKKPLAFGGLLARVQQKRACPESSPEPGPSHDHPDNATPERKRPRETVQQGESNLALSGKKAAAPPSLLKRLAVAADAVPQPQAAPEIKPRPADVPAIKKDCGAGAAAMTLSGQNFLPLATACSSAADDSASTLADCLRSVAKDASDPQAAVRAAMALIVPMEAVDARALAAAVTEAFGTPCDPRLRGEALAAKAQEARQCKQDFQSTSALTIVEVAEGMVVASHGAADEDYDLAVRCLAKLLAKTQSGMEPFFLVRALQGKLAQSVDMVHSAVAQALVPANTGDSMVTAN